MSKWSAGDYAVSAAALVVAVSAVAAVFVVAVAAYPESEIDWPAWVQAIGSIAAVLVAIFVSHLQTRRAAHLHELSEKARDAQWRHELSVRFQVRQDRYNAVAAIVSDLRRLMTSFDQAVDVSLRRGQQVKSEIRFHINPRQIENSLAVLRRIDFVEFGSQAAVQGLIGLSLSAEELLSSWDKADKAEDPSQHLAFARAAAFRGLNNADLFLKSPFPDSLIASLALVSAPPGEPPAAAAPPAR